MTNDPWNGTITISIVKAKYAKISTVNKTDYSSSDKIDL